jgi:DNA-binding transcriptional MerR regulator
MSERGELRIGDFSRLSQLSIRVLHHYDLIGLLVPVRVDAANGYRYYAPAQLGDAHRIATLKSLGLGLAEVMTVLRDELTDGEVLGMLRLKHAEAEAARQTAVARLAGLERQMAELRDTGRLADLDVVCGRVSPAPFLAVRASLPDLPAATRAVEQARGAIAAAGLLAAGPVVVVGYEDSHRDEDLDLEIGVLTDRLDPLAAGDGLVLRPTVLRGCDDMASITTRGDPAAEHERALRLLGDWLAATGRHLAGPGREILHPDPTTPAGYILQLQYPTTRLKSVG